MFNFSPALFEAKINLEDFRATNFVYFVDEDGIKSVVLADPEADADVVVAKFDALFDEYLIFAKAAAFENNMEVGEVMHYMDEVYAEVFPNNETHKAYMAK